MVRVSSFVFFKQEERGVVFFLVVELLKFCSTANSSRRTTLRMFSHVKPESENERNRQQ